MLPNIGLMTPSTGKALEDKNKKENVVKVKKTRASCLKVLLSFTITFLL